MLINPEPLKDPTAVERHRKPTNPANPAAVNPRNHTNQVLRVRDHPHPGKVTKAENQVQVKEVPAAKRARVQAPATKAQVHQ